MNARNWNQSGLCLTLGAACALGSGQAVANDAKVPIPRTRPAIHSVATPPAKPAITPAARPEPVPLPAKRAGAPAVTNQPAALSAFAQAGVGMRGALPPQVNLNALVRPASGPFSVAPRGAASAADIGLVKQVIEAVRKGNAVVADVAEKSITDPVARKLAEWVVLRSDNTNPPFIRYANFVKNNPAWPHVPLFRRRAENALWNDKLDDATVRAFFTDKQPTTAKGRFVYARALLAQGDRAAAEGLARLAWRENDASADVEQIVLSQFGHAITREDHKVRMDQRLYNDDITTAMRAAERLGGNEVLIARARAAVTSRAKNAKALLDAVPAAARRDPGYIFSRAQWLRTSGQAEEAAKLILTAPKDPDALVDTDRWWMERRLLVRRLLDDNDAQTAYRVAREAAAPERGNYRVDQHFTAGWIALRFLNDAPTAATHFARISVGTNSPHALGRAGYWQGRAAEAMGQREKARAFYEAGAQHSATYYGQLARARLGLTDLGLRPAPTFTAQERNVLANLEVVRAAEILYALDERDMLASIYAELGESGTDAAGLAALAELAGRNNDGRAMLLLGKGALGRGLPLDHYAYPTVGLPNYTPVAPPVEQALVYAIARQESHFNQKVVSPANAMGFMQVTPVAAQDTAKRFKTTYNKARLLSDPIYNMQMGAAELRMLLDTYNGSYILTFVGYNAGRGRARQWIAAYGDPRDPKVDPVDWAERIPFAETRNYVQRIMENLQVYRARFGGGSKLLIEADLKSGGVAN